MTVVDMMQQNRHNAIKKNFFYRFVELVEIVQDLQLVPACLAPPQDSAHVLFDLLKAWTGFRLLQ